MSEENLHIDFSIAFTAKTARSDVVLDELSNDDNSLISECSFEGGSQPIMPRLNYFRDDDDINNLIDMRMNDFNSIKSKTYSIKYNATSGIKEKEAIKIDTVLRKLKLIGNGSVASEVEKENRLSLEYHIEF